MAPQVPCGPTALPWSGQEQHPRAPGSQSFAACWDPSGLGPRSITRWRVNRPLRMESLSSSLAPAQQPVGTAAPCCPRALLARPRGVSLTGKGCGAATQTRPPPWGAAQGAQCRSPLPTRTPAPAAQAFPLLMRLRLKLHATDWRKSSATGDGVRLGPLRGAGSQPALAARGRALWSCCSPGSGGAGLGAAAGPRNVWSLTAHPPSSSGTLQESDALSPQPCPGQAAWALGRGSHRARVGAIAHRRSRCGHRCSCPSPSSGPLCPPR